MRLLLLIFVVMLSACKDTQADSDVGLYDPVAPEGSAFVRFLNLAAAEITPEAQGETKGKTYDLLKKMEVSPYFVVPEGDVAFSMGDKNMTTSVLSEHFYTVVNKGALRVLKDQGNDDRSKATIAFYNFSDIPALTLKAREGSVAVLKDVGEGNTSARDMNAVKIDFSIHDADKKLIALPEEVIERGNHYSIIYDGVSVKMVTATTNTRK